MELAPRLRAADKVAERWPACQSVRPSATGRARPRARTGGFIIGNQFDYKFKNLGRPTSLYRVQRLPVANTVSRQHLTPTGTGTYSTYGKRGTKPTFGYP
jgi:hypothetical protein